MLIIHMTVHIGDLRLLKETGAVPALIVPAVAANAAAIGHGAWRLAGHSPMLLGWIGGFFVLALTVEVGLNAITARTVEAWSDGGDGS